MTKKEWLKLAEAMVEEKAWFEELYDAKVGLARKHGGDTDFIGNDMFAGPVYLAVESLMGDDFTYWLYECGGSFADFRVRVTLKDGSSPEVYTLEDLYDFAVGPDGEGAGQDE